MNEVVIDDLFDRAFVQRLRDKAEAAARHVVPELASAVSDLAVATDRLDAVLCRWETAHPANTEEKPCH